jgi:hypothetical protein
VFSDEERVCSALHECPTVSSHLGLKGIACLAASSSGLNHSCYAAASKDATSLLQPAVEAAKAGQLLRQDKQAVVWLVELLQGQGTPTAAAAVAQQLTSLPSVPLDWAAGSSWCAPVLRTAACCSQQHACRSGGVGPGTAAAWCTDRHTSSIQGSLLWR